MTEGVDPNTYVRELFETYSELVLGFLRAQLPMGSRQAQDLLQQTFMAVLETLRRGEVEPPRDARAYLFQVARRRLYAHIGKLARDRDHGEQLESNREVALSAEAEQHDLAYLSNLREDQRLLLRAMRRLPLEQQIPIHLRHWAGLSGPAIAEVLEVPEGTVRSRLRLGIARLKDIVTGLEDTPQPVTETGTKTLARWWQELQNDVPSPSEPDS